MTKLTLTDRIKQLKSFHSGLQLLFKDYIKNKSFPLKERWEIFYAHSKFMLDVTFMTIYFQELKSADMHYNDMPIQHNKTILFKELPNMTESTYGDTYCNEHLNTNQLKEDILKMGLSGFVYYEEIGEEDG